MRTLVVFGVLAFIALTRWVPVSSEVPLEVHHVTVVRPGQTLSEVAHEHLPSLPVREGVTRLQLLNRLTAPEVTVGQSLAIPVVR
ncbi:MAG: LysM peptidoglycan-binding domain-containing protein [Austwickia sp.]|nr:LysM peptidoglycan-binding domain-containing protein [Austwickia sp.]MBK9101390.1 LysM peptidoglycan-binding domain-containing protein [Austwickia sp.]